MNRQQALLGWDDETVRSRSVLSPDATPVDVTTPADLFEVLPAGADLVRVERALELALALAEAENRLPPGERVRLRRVEGLARVLRTD